MMILFIFILGQLFVGLQCFSFCNTYDFYVSPDNIYMYNITQLGRAIAEDCQELFETAVGTILFIQYNTIFPQYLKTFVF